jgi:uncharacterized protein YkwD
MKKRFFAVLMAFVLLCGVFVLPAAAVASNYAATVVTRTNQARANAGVSPALADSNQALKNAAQKRAEEIAVSFSHTRPNGTSCATALDEYGVSYRAYGENIAYGYPTAEAVMEGWMNSTGHRENILQSVFTHLGVGVYEKNGTVYCVQLFIGDGSGGGGNATPSNNTGLWARIVAFFQKAWDFFVRLIFPGLT